MRFFNRNSWITSVGLASTGVSLFIDFGLAVVVFLLVAVVDLAAVAFLVVAFLAGAVFTAGADSAATTFSLVSFGWTVVFGVDSTVSTFFGTSTGLTSVTFHW